MSVFLNIMTMAHEITDTEDLSIQKRKRHKDFCCLICTSQDSLPLKSISGDNDKLFDYFCNLYNINNLNYRADIQLIFQDSSFCRQCHEELSEIETLYSKIKNLNNEIQRIKINYDSKLVLLEANDADIDVTLSKKSFDRKTLKNREQLYNYAFHYQKPTTETLFVHNSDLKPLFSSEPSESKNTSNFHAISVFRDFNNKSMLQSVEKNEDIVTVGIETESYELDTLETCYDDDPLASVSVVAVTEDCGSFLPSESRQELSKRCMNDVASSFCVLNDNDDDRDAKTLTVEYALVKKKYNLKELSIPVERLKIEPRSTASKNLSQKKQQKGVRIPRRVLPFACSHPGCFKKFSLQIQLDGHVKRAHEGNSHPFTCEICNRRFSSYPESVDHQNVHTSVSSYQCSICAKTYKTKLYLRQHKKRVHTSKRYCCELCGREVLNRALYDNHMRSHTKEKPFVCDICGKSFPLSQSLKNHRFTHPELKLDSTKCKYCGKIFSGRYYLSIHERQHTGDLKFKCEICNYVCGLQSHLNRHMQTHLEVKNFECDVCTRKYKSAVILTQHKKKCHPLSKDFMCLHCGKCFSCKKYLDVHEEIHKEIKRLLCTLCGKSFAQHTSYNYHMKHTHKDGSSDN